MIRASTILGRLVIIGLLALMVTGASAAQAPSAAPTPRTITVVGEGTVSTSPDVVRVNLGVETRADTARAATTQAETTLDDVVAALDAQGVAAKDIQTSGYHVRLDRGRDRWGNEREPGYFVMNTLQVTVRDVDAVGAVLEAAIDAGANVVHGVRFAVDDPSTYWAEARKLASVDARERALELADLTGVELGPVVAVRDNVGPAPGMIIRDRGLTGTPAPTAPDRRPGTMRPGQMDLQMRLQVVYAIQ